jgi:DNA-binding transcriptional regulator LsrR (DeoR family)
VAAKQKDDTLLYELAELHYEHQITQADLADRFGLSAMAVSRLLKEARQKGIVTITVRKRIPRAPEYERKLVEKFHLTNAVVVDAGFEARLDLIPEAAAQHLQLLLRPDITVGFGVGPTIARAVNYLHSQRVSGATVVQLAGGYHEVGDAYSHDIVQKASEILGAKGIYFHAPMLFRSVEAKDIVLREVIDASLLRHWRQCAMALIVVNPIRAEAMTVETGFVTLRDLQELRDDGAVGVLLGHYYDVDGRFLDHDVNRRVASIPLDVLQGIPDVIAINRYSDSENAMLGALRTGLLNTVVTDAHTAQEVCAR